MPEKTGHALPLVNTYSKLHGFHTERNVRQSHMCFIKTPKYEQEDILPKLLDAKPMSANKKHTDIHSMLKVIV